MESFLSIVTLFLFKIVVSELQSVCTFLVKPYLLSVQKIKTGKNAQITIVSHDSSLYPW